MRTTRTGVGLPLLLAGMLAGCGGDSTTQPPPAPPPSPPSVPASIAINGGDNQEAPAGSAVPVQPSVIVKNAAGQGVSGVQVAFAVQGGGGAVAAGTGTTGTNGVATPGAWTLGVDEGPNTLTATVAGLTAVSFHAIGKPTVRIVAEATLPPGGGTLTVNQPGKPVDGTTLRLPPNAFAGPTTVSISSIPLPALQLPAGVAVIGPVLQIAGFPDADSDSLISLKIPVDVPEGTMVAVFIRNPTTGRLEVLPPTRRDPGSITVATRHLSGSRMLSTGPLVAARRAAPLFRSAGVGSDVQLLVLGALASRLAQGIDTPYRPEVDGWEFVNRGSYIAPGGHCAGQSIASMWYYLRAKATYGPLFGKLDHNPNLEYDDPDGYRFSSVVQERLNWDHRQLYKAELAIVTTLGGLSADALVFQTVAMAMLATNEPQYVEVLAPSAGHALVAYRIEANQILVADPNYPEQSRKIDFVDNKFLPYPSRLNANSGDLEFPTIRTMGSTILIPMADIDALWPSVLDHTIGTGVFPGYVLTYFDLLADAWKPLPLTEPLMIRQSELRVRANCPLCAGGVNDGGSGKIQRIRAYSDAGNSIGNGDQPDGITSEGTTFPLEWGTQNVGLYVRGDPGGQEWSYLDFKRIEVAATPFTAEPASVQDKLGATITFTARPFGLRPSTVKYVWDFGDGSEIQTVPGDSVITHPFLKGGEFTTSVEMWDVAANQKVARATVPVSIQDSVIIWRVTKLTGEAPAWTPIHANTRGEYRDHAGFFAAIRENPMIAQIKYFDRPPAEPVGPSASITIAPPPVSGISNVALGRYFDDRACPEGEFMRSIGTATDGTLEGATIRICSVGNPKSVAVAWVHLVAAKAGTKLTGTIGITYKDYAKTNLNITVLDTKVVLYQFEATRAH